MGSKNGKSEQKYAPGGVGIRGGLRPGHEQEKLTVDSYMLAMMTAHDMAKGRTKIAGMELRTSKDETKAESELSSRLSRLAWAFLRDARLFHFDPVIFMEIYHQMDVFTTETIAKIPFRPGCLDDQGNVKMPLTPELSEDADKLVKTLEALSPTAPYPEKFPFEAVYIGLGQGVTLSELQARYKFRNRLPDDLPNYNCDLLGAVMTFSGYVWEFFRLDYLSEGIAYTFLPWRMPDVGWTSTIDLAPWYLPVILDTINDHKTFVVEGYPEGSRAMLRHSRKQMGVKPGKNRGKFWMPPPYYRLRLRDEIVRKRLELSKPQLARQLHYRHDVRGHERCLIRRGILPLDSEIRKRLLKRGYKVYEHTKPSDEMNARLLKRGFVTKKSDEWLAIKVIWVDEHQRGPEDGPYIPALRTTGSKERTLLGVTEGTDARG